jgi:hypothetical protein
MPALDLALRLRMEGRPAHMLHLVGFDVFGKIAGDIAGAIVGQQARFMFNACLIAARCGCVNLSTPPRKLPPWRYNAEKGP